MLSEKITQLFALLQCNNTDIARYAGCSSANISKLKTGYRSPDPDSPSIALLANGVYSYADYENMLPLLSELCASPDTSREVLVPALITWFYDSKPLSLPESKLIPRSRQKRAWQCRIFGERLDQTMTLLDISNHKLADLLNIDASLVSRYRSGIYAPLGNRRLSAKLSWVLLSQAEKTEKTEELAKLCGTDTVHLDLDAVASWLYELSFETDETAMAQKLLLSLDEFPSARGLPGAVGEIPKITEEDCYYGTEGLRSAVIRFLSDAAKEGGELMLYSDEPMEWMIGDRNFFALWASLMMKCVSSGVRIRIIHNVDRGGEEMIDAIRGWFPLYISGMIEPFVFLKEANARFHHTVFLRTGKACILGFSPSGENGSRWYDYITDEKRLSLLEQEFRSMLLNASPFLKVFRQEMSEEYCGYCADLFGAREFLLSELPVFTMPDKLLKQILSRAETGEAEKESLLKRYRRLNRQFRKLLRKDAVNILLCLPEGTSMKNRKINFGLDLLDLSTEYTSEEYAVHIDAVIDLVQKEKNFHLTLLPESPFWDVQIAMPGDAVSVLRCREPYAAFVFLNPNVTGSVSNYLAMLREEYAADRHTTIEALKTLRKQ